MSTLKIGMLSGGCAVAGAHLHQMLLQKAQLNGAREGGVDYPDILHIASGYPGLYGETLEHPTLALPRIVDSIHLLNAAGCTHLVLVNQALHALLPQIKRHTAMHLVSAVEATAQFACQYIGRPTRPFIILGEDVRRGEPFRIALESKGLNVRAASTEMQVAATAIGNNIMAQGLSAELANEFNILLEDTQPRDAVFILANHELTLLSNIRFSHAVIDASAALAYRITADIQKAAMRFAA